jgi:hypothetical protein
MQVNRCVYLLALMAALHTVAQDSSSVETGEARTRQLWNEAFLQQRSQGSPGSATTVVQKTTRQLGNGFLGITLWRMRRAASSDPVRFRGLEHPSEARPADEWTPERSSVEKPLEQGAFARLSIESARAGFLYVINRDQYEDGSKSVPDLVFPTGRLNGGDNSIHPGVPVEIPDGADKPPAFRVTATRPDQTAIVLTFIVSPSPVPELHSSPEARRLSDQMVKIWEQRWLSSTQRIENATVKAAVYSPNEQSAARDRRPLGESDPLPATLFHYTSLKDSDWMIARVILQLKATQR